MDRTPNAVTLDGGPLQLADVEAVARLGAKVEVTDDARQRMSAVRTKLDDAASSAAPHYGINTGFGSFSKERIKPADLRELQANLVRSHSAGVGPALPTDVVRGMMLVLAASLCRAHSGVRQEVVDSVVALLNSGVTPRVPEVGSVGASGDLAPLAHIALVLIGEGEAELDGGETVSGAEALAKAGVAPLTLEAKEGLALLNGTHLMAARLALACLDTERLLRSAVCAASMSLDACRATDRFLDARVYDARNQPGPAAIAKAMRTLLRGSTIVSSHADENDPRVQDPYSIRCTPVVLGAVLDSYRSVRTVAERELGAVTDNPLLFERDGGLDIISAGCFHGMPVAIPLDTLAVQLSHIAGIAERRTYHMISAHDPESRLRAFLSPMPGLHSGFMIAQYTAAACCNELIGLANPASVANLPTSAGIEDYNSFGPRSAAKAARGVYLASRVVAVELLCGAQAIETHRPLRSGDGVETAYEQIRAEVRSLEADRVLSGDIERIGELVLRGDLGGDDLAALV